MNSTQRRIARINGIVVESHEPITEGFTASQYTQIAKIIVNAPEYDAQKSIALSLSKLFASDPAFNARQFLINAGFSKAERFDANSKA